MKRIKLPLFAQILIALVLAVIFGITLPDKVQYISWIGDIFIHILKMIIVPLTLTSIISGIANLSNSENLGRLGLKTISFYIFTSILAIFTGLFLVNIIKPGVGTDIKLIANNDLLLGNSSILDLIVEIVPANIFEALRSENSMLSIIFVAFLFGFFITKVGEKPKNVITNFFNSALEVIMKIVQFIIKFTPFGIFGIVAKVVVEQEDILATTINLGKYMLTVILGLLFHFCVTLPIILKVLGKVNPFAHIKGVSSALITGFSTASSGATLPITMECVRNNSGVSNKISSITLPFGATINMDGTALFQCVAAIFIAQAFGIELSVFEQIIIVLTALLASIGAAAMPNAGLIMLTIVLTAVGLPLEGIGIIFSVDRILDMFRTSVNVFSNTCAAVVIAKSEGEKLKI